METDDPVQALLAKAAKFRISNTELCKRAGIAPSTMVRWKSGERSPNMKSLRSAQDALSQMIEEMMA